MLITEKLMLGQKILGQNICKGILKNNLQPVICNKPFTGPAMYIQCFPSKTDIPWNRTLADSNKIIYISDDVKHKVYTLEEIEFISNFENIKNLTWEKLLLLKKDNNKCSFEVDNKAFVYLINTLKHFYKRFAYKKYVSYISHGLANLGNPRNQPYYSNVISLYSLEEIIVDVYGNSPEGFGISLEILSTQSSRTNGYPFVIYGYYLIVTNEENGVLYRDGNNVFSTIKLGENHIIMNITDFYSYVEHRKQHIKKNSRIFGKKLKSVAVSTQKIKASLKKADRKKILKKEIINRNYYDTNNKTNEIRETLEDNEIRKTLEEIPTYVTDNHYYNTTNNYVTTQLEIDAAVFELKSRCLGKNIKVDHSSDTKHKDTITFSFKTTAEEEPEENQQIEKAAAYAKLLLKK